MNRNILIKEIIDRIQLLPNTKIQKINDFVEMLISNIDDNNLLEGKNGMTTNPKYFEDLENPEKSNSVNDLKEKYKRKIPSDKNRKMISGTKNIIIDELKDTPEEFASEILNFIKFLKIQKQSDAITTHFASEKVLSKDWLKREEDEAWKDL